MKLKNKETGEIGNLVSTNWDEVVLKVLDDNGVQLGKYTSLAGLNEEWEDYGEPKEHWEILAMGGVIKMPDVGAYELQQEIGNYFETAEEAEKAVEKLKAWKRLKEENFKFISWEDKNNPDGSDYVINITAKFDGAVISDLDLLFGRWNES